MHGIFLSKNLVFIDSMQFMNFSLDKLVKNLSISDTAKRYAKANNK